MKPYQLFEKPPLAVQATRRPQGELKRIAAELIRDMSQATLVPEMAHAHTICSHIRMLGFSAYRLKVPGGVMIWAEARK
jgi:hypothetical protein